MGPQLYRCGNSRGDRIPKWAKACFNGAATLSLRKPGRYLVLSCTELKLQWGRNFIVAETWPLPCVVMYRTQASMGPQLYRCGNLAATLCCHVPNSSFNGAATLSLRKPHSRWQGQTHMVGASMGPQLYRCGNGSGSHTQTPLLACFNGAATLSLRKPADGDRCRCGLGGLQWGRNFIVAETHVGLLSVRRTRIASMGPQLYRCGNISIGRTSGTAGSRFNGAATLSLRKRFWHY